MVPIYAICIVLGVVAVLAWVILGMTASTVADKENLEPEQRFGEKGQMAITAVLGFGLGGMSASFAGWSTGLALVGAGVGAVGATLIGRYLGVEESPVGDDS